MLKDELLERASVLWAWMPPPVRRRVLHLTQDRFLVGVVGLIHDGAGRVLLLDHRFRAPHRWGLPGGHIEHGEDLETALVREIREELGLEIAIEPELDGRPFDLEYHVPGRFFSVGFVARAAGTELRFASEIAGGGFFGQDRLPEGVYPHHLALCERFFRRLPRTPERK